MENKTYDVIIIGGSYAGLAAAMALGRSLKRVLVIDGSQPCNRQTPQSHNFLTQDGKAPGEIAAIAKEQVEKYDTVKFFSGIAAGGTKVEKGFEIQLASGETFLAARLIFAAGIRDILPQIDGISECWGISVLHCPYCHGYEVSNKKTGILGNGDNGFDFSVLISNWTKDLTLFTNSKSTLTSEQKAKLEKNQIKIAETSIDKLQHDHGYLTGILFKDGTTMPVSALYAHSGFEQNCSIPKTLGCELTDEGYIKVDEFQRTSIPGIFACGDSTTRMRTVANSVATGAAAGMILNRELVFENFG